MLKQIQRNNFLTVPFVASKKWNLRNIDNEALAVIDDEYIALEYVDYYGNPLLNRDCNITLEQQRKHDRVDVERDRIFGCHE